eukprot:5148351-Amphidinium_carterae.1
MANIKQLLPSMFLEFSLNNRKLKPQRTHPFKEESAARPASCSLHRRGRIHSDFSIRALFWDVT